MRGLPEAPGRGARRTFRSLRRQSGTDEVRGRPARRPREWERDVEIASAAGSPRRFPRAAAELGGAGKRPRERKRAWGFAAPPEGAERPGGGV